jgi:hypothetical protein
VLVITPDQSFRQELTGFGQLDDLELEKGEETYRSEFWQREHSVFLCEKGVVCILHEEARNSHLVLVLDSSGYEKHIIPALQVQGKDFTTACLHWISLNLWPNTDVWLVEEDEVSIFDGGGGGGGGRGFGGGVCVCCVCVCALVVVMCMCVCVCMDGWMDGWMDVCRYV